MSVHPSVSVNELPAKAAAQADTFESPALRNTMRNQRLQDFFFHKVTWLFARPSRNSAWASSPGWSGIR